METVCHVPGASGVDEQVPFFAKVENSDGLIAGKPRIFPKKTAKNAKKCIFLFYP